MRALLRMRRRMMSNNLVTMAGSVLNVCNTQGLDNYRRIVGENLMWFKDRCGHSRATGTVNVLKGKGLTYATVLSPP